MSKKNRCVGKVMWRIMRRAPESDKVLLRKILELAAAYERAQIDRGEAPQSQRLVLKASVAIDGVKYYQVGHNASHEFMLGVRDGVAMVLSSGYDEVRECMTYSQRTCGADWRKEYLGHY